MNAMKYDVKVTRDGRWWMIEVPAIDGLTQARRVSEIDDQARSLIAITLDVPSSEVEVKVTSMMVGDVDVLTIAEHVKSLRAEAEQAEARAIEATREAALALTKDEAPMRDIGALLGVSHQRVSQLVTPK